MKQDVVRTGTLNNFHYIIFRSEPHWFRAEIFDSNGNSQGTTWAFYTIKKAWDEAIECIAVYFSAIKEDTKP